MAVAVALGAWDDTGTPAYAVIATEGGASYFYPSAKDALKGYDDDRISDQVKKRFGDDNPQPDTPGGWIKFLASIGPSGVILARFEQAESESDAKKIARGLFADAKSNPGLYRIPDPERAAALAGVSEDFRKWAEEFPEAADALDDPGEEVDAEAAHALMVLLYPPTRPDEKHSWMPLKLGEDACMVCEQAEDAEVHV